MPPPPYRVVVVGLPKTGTSTLAVMLKMVGYHVTGPNPELARGDDDALCAAFERYEGFQDYPWCFEWTRWADREDVRFIVLEREPQRWWDSFLLSYGDPGEAYLSYPYMQIPKLPERQDDFLAFHRSYYEEARAFASKHPDRALLTSVKDIRWESLCALLDAEPPRDARGRVVPKPHVHQEHHRERTTLRYRAMEAARHIARQTLLPAVGERRWQRFVTFLRANRLY